MMGEKGGVCVPSDLLQHVYSFLVQGNYMKAAKALQKATEEVRVHENNVRHVVWSLRLLPSLLLHCVKGRWGCWTSIPSTRAGNVHMEVWWY